MIRERAWMLYYTYIACIVKELKTYIKCHYIADSP